MTLRKHDLEIVVTACLAIYMAYIGINGPWTPAHIAGAILLVAGFIGWLTARLQIREFFTPRAEARGLVTTGLYSKIRNPIYFFGLVFFAGLVLYLSIPRWGLLLMLLIIVMQVWRARNEARVLEAKFGDAYRQYRAKTWF
ncbi:MAG: isoprenylcysteine carboxylmethyltransferase family protein [Candidatus Acidiferrales bacterium]